ncbi:MAG: hypothetical protein FJW09_00965 [Actinobacteria bacterium]|nr:hypothetical protein [Actinomycetota bacterium]
MAAEDDDEILDPDEIDSEAFLEEGEDADEALLEGDELDEELGLEDADETVPLMDEEAEGDDPPAVVPKKKAKKSKKDAVAEEEEDEDDELVGEDDVEADLGVILDARIKGRSEEDDEEVEEEEEEEVSSASDPESGIQPRRADERMCNQCFLLVRKGAPACPVGDDTCPLFS